MKTYIVLFLFFTISVTYCQEKGIILKKNNATQTSFLQEHKRIRLKTNDGKVFVGKFTILDENTISINEKPILLDSIVKIKRRSLMSSIGSPFVVAGGVVLVFAGVVGAYSGGYAVILALGIPPGIPMILVPSISNNHIAEKWDYTIGTNSKQKNISKDINENQ